MTIFLAMSQDVVLAAIGIVLLLVLLTDRLGEWLRAGEPLPAPPPAPRTAPRAPADPDRLSDP